MKDFFGALKQFETAKKVSNFYQEVAEREPVNFLFFTCPARKPFKINRYKTGFTTTYLEGITPASLQGIERVKCFLREFQEKVKEINFSCTCIFANADGLILFPIPLKPPQIPEIQGYQVLGNYELVLNNLHTWVDLFKERPWEKIPQRILEMEKIRFSSLFLFHPPANLLEEFIRRSWAGFALDGILARDDHFGRNPVLLGVEGEGVAMLQNAALSRDQWLPVILLK